MFTLPTSITCIPQGKEILAPPQRIFLGADLVIGCGLIALGILSLLGVGKISLPGINSFSQLGQSLSYGGIVGVGALLSLGALITLIILKVKAGNFRREAYRATFQQASQRYDAINKKIAEIDFETLPKPFEDDLATTKRKAEAMLKLCEGLYHDSCHTAYESEEKEFISKFLATEFSEVDWSDNYRYKRELSRSFTSYYNDFIPALRLSVESERLKVVQEMIDGHAGLFPVKEKRKARVDEHWFHFPLLREEERITFFPTENPLETVVECIESGESRALIEHQIRSIQKDLDHSDVFGSGPIALKEFIRTELADEYKIHLMPKPENISVVIELLLEALETNQKLKDAILTFKVSRHADIRSEHGRIVPVIVIYPRFTKAYAQQALTGLLSSFKSHFDLGCGQCPRFNADLGNPLIYYAQGDSQEKMTLSEEKPQLFNKLYDAAGTHYHPSFGDFKLVATLS